MPLGLSLPSILPARSAKSKHFHKSMEMTDRYQKGRWYAGVQYLDFSVRAQPDPESDRQDSTHENSHSTFREELNADV